LDHRGREGRGEGGDEETEWWSWKREGRGKVVDNDEVFFFSIARKDIFTRERTTPHTVGPPPRMIGRCP
jgi:hypothetical protein